MPHFDSFERSLDYPVSPKSEWYDYMDETDTLFYEQKFIDMITGESQRQHDILETGDELFEMLPSVSGVTASRKPFMFNTDLSVNSHREWMVKELRHWTSSDIMDWITSVAESFNYKYELIDMPSFIVDGLTLSNMTETEFVSRAPEFGRTLFLSMQHIRQGYGCDFNRTTPQLPPFAPSFRSDREKTPSFREEVHTLTQLNERGMDYGLENNSQSGVLSDGESESSVVQPPPPVKRTPGRPRGTRTKKKPEKRCGRLWEFIRDLLLNPEYCPSLICWDDHENGVFRFVHSEKVARLWGTIKENPKMNYEKLSRAMRYYYKGKVLQAVLGRRLVYKFGPTATGWRTPNPNFVNGK